MPFRAFGRHDAEMTEPQCTIAEAIERYLRTGETDPYCSAWPGNFLERAQRANKDLREALVREVRRLSAGLTHELTPESDTVSLTHAKVEPMVKKYSADAKTVSIKTPGFLN